jgi:hypothetical protein
LDISGSQNIAAQLEKYAKEFVKDFLDGPQGVNTQIREDYPSEPDEALTEDLGRMEKNFNTVSLDSEWLNFRLFTGYPGRRHREYYLTHLSDGFIVVLEFEGATKSSDSELNKAIEERNIKTASTIINSIRITNLSLSA